MILCISCHIYPANRPHNLCDFCWESRASQAFIEMLRCHPLPYGTWLVDWYCPEFDNPYAQFETWEREVRLHPEYDRLCDELGDEPGLLELIDAYYEHSTEWLYPVERLHCFLANVGYAIARALPKGGNPF